MGSSGCGKYAQEHVGLRVMRVDLSRPTEGGQWLPRYPWLSDQLSIAEHMKEEQPGGAGCGRATWVQTEPVRHVLDNF